MRAIIFRRIISRLLILTEFWWNCCIILYDKITKLCELQICFNSIRLTL